MDFLERQLEEKDRLNQTQEEINLRLENEQKWFREILQNKEQEIQAIRKNHL